MKQFWTKKGLFFTLFINRVIAVFAKKIPNSLIISRRRRQATGMKMMELSILINA